ncbi:MAG: hypothetical protein JRG80_19800, partial [Deltaproteobacteria bacterium]|nr:hypothetical protein [Deltaproteobacteria bacterium]
MVRCNLKGLRVVVLVVLSWTWAGAAFAVPVTVNFDNPQDSLWVGLDLPSPFESADSDLLQFSHTTVPNALFMQNIPAFTVAGNGLFV